MKKIFVVLVLMVMMLLPAAATTKSLYVGESTLLAAPNPPGNAAINQTAWGCSSPYVKVEKYGVYGAKATVLSYFTGSAEIRCDYYYYWYDNRGFMHTNHATTYFLITCREVTLKIQPTQMYLSPGESQDISYSYSPSNVRPAPTIRFYSNNTNVARVSSSGRVVAVGSGSATITVENSAGSNASCYVKVKAVDPTSVSIQRTMDVYVGESQTLYPTLSPSDAQTSYTWRSNNSDVATVTDGSVYGKAEGRTTVYCVTKNGLHSNNCEVTVRYRKATSITLSKNKLTIPIGEERTLTWKLVPSNAKAAVTWRSENSRVASVSSSGVVSAKKQGRTMIWAETDNGLKASCEVIVPPNPSSLELPDAINFFEGRTIQMPLQVYPSDAYAQIAWSSSDETVAKVDDQGKVSLRAVGTAVIQATSQNGLSASCRLTVKFPTNYLLLWLKDGRLEQYRLQTHPRVTYADGKLWVHSSEVSIGYPAEEVRKYTIGGDAAIRVPTGISDVEASRPDDWCQMAKARPGSKILVYDVNGHLLTTGIVAQDGTYQYSLDAYPAGIYLIKTETTTIKIIKR